MKHVTRKQDEERGMVSVVALQEVVVAVAVAIAVVIVVAVVAAGLGGVGQNT